MASGKEIRNKIKSVESTRKITKAMEMVAASKMRKAQDRMRAARPYGEKIRRVAGNLSHALTDYSHPFLEKRSEVKAVGLIAITSDKGLCGGLNTNVLRLALGKMKEWDAEGKKLKVTAVGNKGFGFMMRAGADIVSHLVGLGDSLSHGSRDDRQHHQCLCARLQINDFTHLRIVFIIIVWSMLKKRR